MTTAVGAEKRRAPASSTLVLLVLAGVAWLATIVWIAALDMSLEAGTMGLSIGEFVVMWTLMMAAMMLPAVSPLVSMYARSVRGSASALTAFGAGYLLVWAATGVRGVRADVAVRQARRGEHRRRSRGRRRRLRRVRRLPADADEALVLAPLPQPDLAPAALRRLPGPHAASAGRRTPRPGVRRLLLGHDARPAGCRA